jgi:hypothetical protein
MILPDIVRPHAAAMGQHMPLVAPAGGVREGQPTIAVQKKQVDDLFGAQVLRGGALLHGSGLMLRPRDPRPSGRECSGIGRYDRRSDTAEKPLELNARF